MNYYFKWKLTKTNRAIFICEDGSEKEMSLNILYSIMPFIQLGDYCTIVDSKLTLITEDQEEDAPLQLTYDGV